MAMFSSILPTPIRLRGTCFEAKQLNLLVAALPAWRPGLLFPRDFAHIIISLTGDDFG
jgi:hypothetical protein